MKTVSSQKLHDVEIRGGVVRLNFDAKEVTKEGMNGPEMYWECLTASFPEGSTREVVIQAVIGTRFSLADEIALINNQVTKPDEYAAYQAFRAKAKTLADEFKG
jgi:hypothetical protein